MTLERLTPAALARRTQHGGAEPGELAASRRALPLSIVHLGVGAFARAHLGTYVDGLPALGIGAAIHGISLRSDRAERCLAPQQGLYTVNVREPEAAGPPEVIGALTRVSTGAGPAETAIASPATELVTLTVTEKGYTHPDDGSVSAAMVIARGLARRDRNRPPTIAPLDNLRGNGRVLRRLVVESADSFDPDLASWIESDVTFCDSVVDRIVPTTTPADRAAVAEQLGLDDHGAVICEEHRSWFISGYDGIIPLDAVGVELVTDAAPFERRKLWLLNGPHSALAYAGLLTGCDSIAAATDRAEVHTFVHALVDDVLEVADLPAALDPAAFAASAMRRFANPALGHRCLQVAADGSTKLPQRIVPAAEARAVAGRSNRRLAVLVAIWIAAVSAIEIDGTRLPRPDDPIGASLDRLTVRQRADVALRALGVDRHPFAADVIAALEDLSRTGPAVLAVET